ncbi:MAG: hypothetical protein WC538_19820 [Thermoanaerobaculia bacterium]
MKRIGLALFGVLLVGLHLGVAADEFTEDVLLPVFVADYPGAQGSIWASEFVVYNSSTTPISLSPVCAVAVPCISFWAPAKSTSQPIPIPENADGSPGYNVKITHQDLPFLALQLRVFDRSRAGLNFGTTIPVVRWSTVHSNVVRFARVPADPRFRHTLRIYSQDGYDSKVTVRYFSDAQTEGAPLFSREYSLVDSNELNPGYLELSSLSLPPFDGGAYLRIEVTAAAEKRIWGLLSVTNMDTQFVTVLGSE